MPRYKTLTERLLERVEFTDTCWNWTGSTRNGYGQIGRNFTKLYTHRLVWQLAYGDIPEGKCVLHHCDNKCCVRPSHLFIGTRKDNTHDMIKKGRCGRKGDIQALSLPSGLSRSEYVAEWRALHKKLGLCRACNRPVLKGFTACRVHYKKSKEYNREQQRKYRKKKEVV